MIFPKTFKKLSEKSGIITETKNMAKFQTLVMNGEWIAASKIIPKISKIKS